MNLNAYTTVYACRSNCNFQAKCIYAWGNNKRIGVHPFDVWICGHSNSNSPSSVQSQAAYSLNRNQRQEVTSWLAVVLSGTTGEHFWMRSEVPLKKKTLVQWLRKLWGCFPVHSLHVRLYIGSSNLLNPTPKTQLSLNWKRKNSSKYRLFSAVPFCWFCTRRRSHRWRPAVVRPDKNTNTCICWICNDCAIWWQMLLE